TILKFIKQRLSPFTQPVTLYYQNICSSHVNCIQSPSRDLPQYDTSFLYAHLPSYITFSECTS
ncbi:hypothetical protein CHS0354_029823, partial [Potamilus streckersoni]